MRKVGVGARSPCQKPSVIHKTTRTTTRRVSNTAAHLCAHEYVATPLSARNSLVRSLTPALALLPSLAHKHTTIAHQHHAESLTSGPSITSATPLRAAAATNASLSLTFKPLHPKVPGGGPETAFERYE